MKETKMDTDKETKPEAKTPEAEAVENAAPAQPEDTHAADQNAAKPAEETQAEAEGAKSAEDESAEDKQTEDNTATEDKPAEDKPAEAPAQPDWKDRYARAMADFDNFRKRTLQEKADLIKSAASRAMVDLLPVVDDFERAIDAMHTTDDIDSMKEGIQLIYNKFIKYLESQNVKAIESNGQPFDTDLHEAVTMFPAPSPELKGRVVDTTLKGYRIGDKVIRHAKVVVGQ